MRLHRASVFHLRWSPVGAVVSYIHPPKRVIPRGGGPLFSPLRTNFFGFRPKLMMSRYCLCDTVSSSDLTSEEVAVSHCLCQSCPKRSEAATLSIPQNAGSPWRCSDFPPFPKLAHCGGRLSGEES